MDFLRKNKAQLFEEIQRLQQRIHELEMSLKVHQKECVRRVENLETSHDYLQAVIDNIGDPVLVIDPKYRVVLANKRVKEIAGGIALLKTDFAATRSHTTATNPAQGKKSPAL